MKKTLIAAYAWLITRTGGSSAADRGEGPIPTAWIVVGGALLAITVMAAITAAGNRAINPLNDLFK